MALGGCVVVTKVVEEVCSRCREVKGDDGLCYPCAFMVLDALHYGHEVDRGEVPPLCPYHLEHIVEGQGQ